MGQDQLERHEDNPNAPESPEKLSALRDRLDTFVQTHSPQITFPEGTHTIDMVESRHAHFCQMTLVS